MARPRRALAASLSFALLIGSAVPDIRAGGKAVAVLARATGVWFPRPFAPSVEVRTVTLAGDVRADVYLPGVPAQAIVLVPGATRAGRRDARVVRLARALAGAHRAVLVPELELRRRVLEWEDVERIASAVEAAAAWPGEVALLGFSYGGSLALIAATRVPHDLALVATFGAYHRLLAVVQGVTTGATTYRGRVVPWRTVPEARAILEAAVVGLLPAADREPLRAALASGDRSPLPPRLAAVHDLVTNDDPRRTFALARRLPRDLRETFARFSPASHLHRLRAPLYLMQAEHDPATPPTEALHLRDAVPGADLIRLRTFLHVDPGSGSVADVAADAWGAWRFAWWVLRAQE